MGRNLCANISGQTSSHYAGWSSIIDTITNLLEADPAAEQAFKLTGISGAGRTMTITTIERRMEENDQWVVVGLSSENNIIKDLVANLYNKIPFLSDYVNAELNLSKFGVGLNNSTKNPVASLDYALKKILFKIKSEEKKLLVTIKDAKNTTALVDFIQEFQMLIREDLPIYLIVAGSKESIAEIENMDGITFFLRALEFEITPPKKNVELY